MEVVVGATSGLIGSVLNMLSNELVGAYVASSQLGLNSTEIKRDLMLTRGLLQEAQRSGVVDNPSLQGLMQELSAKAYEAEDTLDELHYFIIQDQLDGTQHAVPDLGDDLRSHARHGRHALRHTIGNCLGCFSCSRVKDGDDGVAIDVIPNNPRNAILNPVSGGNDGSVAKLPFDRVTMSKKIKSVIEDMQSLCDRASKLLHIIPHHNTTAIATLRHRDTGSIIVQDILYGRRAIFEKTIVDILTIATYRRETLSVLPIVGPGGIGKTTFTQHIYNDKRIEQHFAVRVWVCVSNDFDELRLSQQILNCIEGSNSPNQTTSFDQLQVSITQKLKSKRFLIVFDDIWECNSEGWKKLLAPFMKGEAKGNMVLVTTRFPSKAEVVKTTHPIALQGLEFDDFFTFFKSLIFGGNKPEYCQEDLDDLAIGIAKKLKGSPLAAKTVGRLLRKDFSREHWMGVLENNEWQKQKNDDDIMPSLRISYDYLPFHLKKCFSYFSLFPEGYWFRDFDITHFWIALGIIEKDENYIEELVENGFLVKEIDYLEKQYYVMHDLLHELSRTVSSQECLNICTSSFRVGAIPQTVRHISFTMENCFEGDFREEMIKLKSKIEIANLRALMIFWKYEETIDVVLKDIFKEVESLRVLYIVARAPESLPVNFSKLIHLRYLKVTKPYSFSWVEWTPPSTLSRFYHLKFLDLGGHGISYKLPKDISRLINLRHFCVENELHSNVPGVGKMKCLQELKEFRVKKESLGFELRELGELTELGGELSIHNLEKVPTKEEATEAKLVCKRDLKELRLFWGTDHQHSTESDVLDALQPHPNLGALHIINHGGSTGPSWLCGDISIKKLGSLHLEGVSWGTLPPFGQLLHLTSLTLINIPVLCEIRSGFGGVTDNSFVHLKRIILCCLPEFIEWVGGANAHSFSKLEYIYCTNCPNLCAVPFLKRSVSYTNLLYLHINGCPKLSLPPMPHTSTLTSFYVSRLGSASPERSNLLERFFVGLCFSSGLYITSPYIYSRYGMVTIKGYSGELALSNLHKVATMDIIDVSHVSLTELSKLKSLLRLNVSRCNITCHGLQDLTWLQSLTVRDCPNFFRWPVESAHTIKPFLASLKKLEIEGESGMQSMALLSNLTCLTDLELVDCENLTMDGFNPLITVNLDRLAVYNTDKCLGRSVSADLFSELAVASTNLSWPAGSFQLQYLTVDCISAVLVAPICSLLAPTLKRLTFWYDQRAGGFTGEEDGALQLLTSLNFVYFKHCPNLPSLPQGLHSLPSLEQLCVEDCPQIRSLPKGAFAPSLQRLTVESCSSELQEEVEKLKATNPDFQVWLE